MIRELYSDRMCLGTIASDDTIYTHKKIKNIKIEFNYQSKCLSCITELDISPYTKYMIKIKLNHIICILSCKYKPFIFILRNPPHIFEETITQGKGYWERASDFTIDREKNPNSMGFGLCNVVFFDIETFKTSENVKELIEFGLKPFKYEFEIKKPPEPVDPYKQDLDEMVLYKLESCFANRYFNKWQLTQEFYDIIKKFPSKIVVKAIEKMGNLALRILKESGLFLKRERYIKSLLNLDCKKMILNCLKYVAVEKNDTITVAKIEEIESKGNTASGINDIKALVEENQSPNNHILEDQKSSGIIDKNDNTINNNSDNISINIVKPSEAIYRALNKADAYLLKKKDNSERISFYTKTVFITPTRIIPSGPFIDISNRVLRNFDPNLFIRINFVDENQKRLYSSRIKGSVLELFTDLLHNGIYVAGEKYIFFACSSSQLRTNGCWFIKENAPKGSTREDIWNWMGDFSSIQTPAKFLARLGQSLSTTIKVSETLPEYVCEIPDIEYNGYCFSDGIGRISQEYADEIYEELERKLGYTNEIRETPSAYQIRYAGIKGVVAIHKDLKNKKLEYRNSMKKYDSEVTHLEVISFSKYSPAYLNKQIIVILSELGVPDEVFINLFQTTLQDVKDVSENLNTKKMIQYDIPYVYTMAKSGFTRDEAFLSGILDAFAAKTLSCLKLKTKLFVEQGRNCIGVLDETQSLEYGQVFLRVTTPWNPREKTVIKGKVVVCKCPALHPGDVRVFECVDEPKLYHLVDCIVFPSKGPRPHPNELSGSDLDGDVYFVSWDERLIFPKNEEPHDYKGVEVKKYDKITAKDLVDFYISYMANDNLGLIANTHLKYAILDSVRCSKCIELAKLHSIAVDSAKTGHFVTLPNEFKIPPSPTLGKRSVLLKLDDMADRSIPNPEYQRKEIKIDQDLLLKGYENYVQQANRLLRQYNHNFKSLMRRYKVKSEEEFISLNFLKIENSKSATKFIKNIPWIKQLIHSTQRTYRKLIMAMEPQNKNEVEDEVTELRKKVSACYYVTYSQAWKESKPLLSFAWVYLDVLCEIKAQSKTQSNQNGLDL